MTHKTCFALAAGALLSGCLYLPLGKMPRLDVAGLSVGNAQVLVSPRIREGGYRTQAAVVRYTQDDIDHLVVKVYKLGDGDAEVPVADPKESGKQLAKVFKHEDLGGSVTIAGLASDTRYRLRAFAYSSAGDDPAHLINDTQTSSAVDIKVETDDRPAVAELPVQLIDKVFDGQGTSSVEVKPGQVVDVGNEGFE